MAVKKIMVRAHKSPFLAASAEETLRQNLIGDNVGNLVFSQSVFKLLSRDDTDVVPLRKARARRLNDEVDTLVLPLANAFRQSFAAQLASMTTLIRKLDIPVVVVGVGAQATVAGELKRHAGIEDVVKDFVAAVLDRSASIGVRGEYTRDYLVNLGFSDSDVDVIGCPSMFMNGPQLSVSRKVERIETEAPLALNVTPYRKLMGPLSVVNAREYPNLTYFAQDIRTLKLLIDGEYDGRIVSKRLPVRLGHPLIRDDRTIFCVDPNTWFDELARRDFSFGTRIHGNIAAILAGTPALVLAHDSRTLELVDHHKIPYALLDEVDPRSLAADLYESVDLGPMLAAHQANWETFSAFLARNGLGHVFEEGQDPHAFDRRLSEVDFPAPVRTLMGAPPAELYAMKRELDSLRSGRRRPR